MAERVEELGSSTVRHLSIENKVKYVEVEAEMLKYFIIYKVILGRW